jgi:V/A-type H+-transporting ATPase subunit C
LAALGSLAEILAALPDALRRDMEGASEIPVVFNRMDRKAADVAAKVLHSGAPAIARAFAYLILRERDLRSVRAVLRGRHLGLPTGDIQQALHQMHEGA